MSLFVQPHVALIATTSLWLPDTPDYSLGEDSLDDGEELAVFAGRNCYQSWERPNPETATTRGYLKNILRQKHWSVLEHANASFYITGVSRSLTHELIRHRHIPRSELSQRYVDADEINFVIPPLYENDPEAIHDLEQSASAALSKYHKWVQTYRGRGASHKEAREAARAHLPGNAETRIVVTGNYRAWMDFLIQRDADGVDKEMRRIAAWIGRELRDQAPNVFGPSAREIWQPSTPAQAA
ncbi:FAD-dependent thymidylate synthase [Nocardia sp. NPDC127526]|uniref:FAD-dependent thymidylate synthase n=1 Tax=Nocardia sp. NPDC127526 TaxID=3345393 RepID=UPI00363B13D9